MSPGNAAAKRRVVSARETILAAGAFVSPQLLMLSGIGKARELAKHGIPLVRDLPGVGENLQDHLDVTLEYRAKSTTPYGISVEGPAAQHPACPRLGFPQTWAVFLHDRRGRRLISTDPKATGPTSSFSFVPDAPTPRPPRVSPATASSCISASSGRAASGASR